MPDRTFDDAIGADVIDESPDTVLVRYEDGGVESVSKQSTHGVLCGVDFLSRNVEIAASGRALVDRANFDTGGTGIDIEFSISPVSQGQITIGNDDTSVEVTGTDLTSVLLSVIDSVDPDDDDFDQTDIALETEDATELFDVYERILESQVRRDIIDDLVGYFGTSVEATEDGWIVEDTYLVTYEAENYLLNELDTYERSGSDVTKLDSEPEAIGVTFDTDSLAQIDFSVATYTLSETEQRFVATVELLLNPDQYLNVEGFQNEVYSAIVRGKGQSIEDVVQIALTNDVSHFVDPKTGLLHRHGVNKHVLRSTFNLSAWVLDELHYDSFDHAGLGELAWREDELRADSRDVFYDTDNDDDDRWKSINRKESNAPCPSHVYKRLRALYGSK